MNRPLAFVLILATFTACGLDHTAPKNSEAGEAEYSSADSLKACPSPNPQGCSVSADCGAGRRCVFTAQVGCAPSSCSCDASTNSWTCTTACAPGRCIDDLPPTCAGPNPQGCSVDSDCGTGRRCVFAAQVGCAPSACACESSTSSWTCTTDCAAGRCIDK
jgi:hypothetical protein